MSEPDGETDITREWASTMHGHISDGYTRPHSGRLDYVPIDSSGVVLLSTFVRDVNRRMELERLTLSPSATFSTREGVREQDELPGIRARENVPLAGIDFRTCFEVDRDRIQHSNPFRRLAGKTQVHLNPSDHQRTRLTHALEVAQIAAAISEALNLNSALTQAIALGHDCGHGPGGHASEDALSIFLPEGFRHARFGADVTLKKYNLCQETLDGIRNHSWSLNTPMTPEGEVVAFADRIAYVCHDLEDALSCHMITRKDFPSELRLFLNYSRAAQIDFFIRSVIEATIESSTIAMTSEAGEMLGQMRTFNRERIYMHPDSVAANDNVIVTLRELVSFYAENPDELPTDVRDAMSKGDLPVRAIVEYVAGMTDDYAYRQHQKHLQHRDVVDPHALFTF